MQSCSLRSLAAGFLSESQNDTYYPLLERAGAIIVDARARARIQIGKPFFCGSRWSRLVSLLKAAPPSFRFFLPGLTTCPKSGDQDQS